MNIKPKIKKGVTLFLETFKSVIYPDAIPVIGIGGLGNFGDILNVKLIEYLTNKKVVKARYSYIEKIKSLFNIGCNYAVIGSILQWSRKNTVVWGAGLLSNFVEIDNKPKRICAVRGPLTRDILLKKGYSCPEIYGDPALLLPYVYRPKDKAPVYKLGIIPHYIDKNASWIKSMQESNDVLIIDIITDDWEKLVNQIVSCESIISSSLHGIILADAYHISSLWVEFSDKVMGDGFKFKDYNLSVGKPELNPVRIDSLTEVDELILLAKNWNINFDYKKLIHSCPFKIDETKFL